MDIYRPKKDPRPSRRKDKDNPYEIFSVGIDTDSPHFYVSFKDGQGVQICMEIDKAVFDLLDRFELDDLSFLNEWDRHIEHSELTESALHARAIARHGLRHIRFHDLRHTCASLLLKNGVPMKQIQEWLGHSDFSTTANIYAHLDYNSKLNSAQAMMTGMSAALITVG